MQPLKEGHAHPPIGGTMTVEDLPLRRVQITSGSLAADWVARHATYLGHPLSAIQERGKPIHMFADDELLVRHDDATTIQHLVSRYNATVEQSLPIPPQPKGMDPARCRSVEGMPQWVRVRFRGEDIPITTLDAAALEHANGLLQVTSRAGAGTLALAHMLGSDGRRIMLNSVGDTNTLPASSSSESVLYDNTTDPYQWPEFSAPSQVARGWQLVNAYGQVRSFASPVFLGIFDCGFNLDAQGRPVGPNPDVTTFIQYNLDAEGQPAGGPNNESGKEWHGNGILSVAAAPIGNSAGAAGAGGVLTAAGVPVVVPVLFKNFRTVNQIFRCLQLSVAWGVDVINMSFSIKCPKILLPISGHWDDNFSFATDQGVVVVASAGNDGNELPDNVVFPATRTPGTITVGALDADNLTRRGDSNYGSSVDIWAPGTNIHVMPYPNNPSGGAWSGTSVAAPIVSGIVSLMKAIQPTLHTNDVKNILRDTSYHSSDPKVTAALDAYAALLRTMGNQLPPGTIEEPNNSPQTARTILPDPNDILAPEGVTILSHKRDEDWWQFNVTQYSMCVVSVKYVPELSLVHVELVPDDPDSPAPGKFVLDQFSGERRITTAAIPPGLYRVMVRGTAPNIYELRVTLTPHPLTPDIFEVNNSFEQAAQLTMDARRHAKFDPVRNLYRPGSYEANLHVPTDVDFFHITNISLIPLVVSTFLILESDAPLDVTIFRSDKTVFQQANGIRAREFQLPGPECWVRVSSATANQYVFQIGTKEKENTIPGLEADDQLHVPHWWPDPPFRLDKWEKYLRVEITNELKQIGKIRLTSSQALTLEVLSPTTGEVLASGAKSDANVPHVVDLEVSELSEGTYLLRVGRDLIPGQRLNRRLSKSLATFNVGPAW